MTRDESILKLVNVSGSPKKSREGVGGRPTDKTYGPYARHLMGSDPRTSGEIAKACGLTKKTVDLIRTSTQGMHEETARQFAKAYALDPSEFIRAAQEYRDSMGAESVPLNKLPKVAEIIAAAKRLAPTVCEVCLRRVQVMTFQFPTPENVVGVATEYHRTQHPKTPSRKR